MSLQNTETPPSIPTGRTFVGYIMRYGFILEISMSLQFLSILLYKIGALSALLYVGLFFCIPVLIVALARHYRRQVRNDSMTYMEAVGFMMGTFLFAMIPTILAYYLGFSRLMSDPVWLETIQTLVDTWISQSPQASEEEIEALRGMLHMTPRQLATQFAATAMFLGMIYIYIAAFFVKKTR